MLSSVLKLSDLQKRREPKKEIDRIIQIRGKDESKEKRVDEEPEGEEKEKEKEKEDEPKESQEKGEPMEKMVMIKDKRSTTK